MVYSAGIIPFRMNEGEMEFFVGHPGGRHWENKNYWAYLKGCVEDGEDWLGTALREFKEESGLKLEGVTNYDLIALGSVLQNPTKTAIAYGLHYPNIDPNECHSNICEEGTHPEVDRYRWMTLAQLRNVTHKTHIVFYQRIIDMFTVVEV